MILAQIIQSHYDRTTSVIPNFSVQIIEEIYSFTSNIGAVGYLHYCPFVIMTYYKPAKPLFANHFSLS